MSGASPQLVRLERHGALAEIILDSPPVNELSPRFVEALERAVEQIGDARAVLIRSAVPRVFMAGGDISFMAQAPVREQEAYVRRLQRLFLRFEQIEQPVVVGIDGAALGGGTEIALTCDVRIAARDVKMGLPEVTLGIFPGAGGTHRLVRSVGQAVARDLMLTGRRISGEEAGAIGLVSRVVEPGEATATAREIAQALADGAYEAIIAIKRLALMAYDVPPIPSFASEAAEWGIVRRSENAQEGLSAFLEKRRPVFNSEANTDK